MLGVNSSAGFTVGDTLVLGNDALTSLVGIWRDEQGSRYELEIQTPGHLEGLVMFYDSTFDTFSHFCMEWNAKTCCHKSKRKSSAGFGELLS